MQLAIALPSESHCGPQRAEYWASGDERVRIGLSITTGRTSNGAGWDGSVFVLVDGVSGEFSLDGGSQSDHHAMHLPAESSRTIEVELGEVAPGRHLVNVLAAFTGHLIVPKLSADLWLYRDATCRGDQAPPVETRPAIAPSGGSYLVDRRRPDSVLSFPDSHLLVGTDHGIPLTLHMEDDFLLPSDRMVVAFLDGKQISLGALGLHPRFKIPVGSEPQEIDFELTDLPVDGQRHRVFFFVVGADEQPPGSQADKRPASDLLTAFTFE